jgi:uncharacterized coiled-coil protein SlyX
MSELAVLSREVLELTESVGQLRHALTVVVARLEQLEEQHGLVRREAEGAWTATPPPHYEELPY